MMTSAVRSNQKTVVRMSGDRDGHQDLSCNKEMGMPYRWRRSSALLSIDCTNETTSTVTTNSATTMTDRSPEHETTIHDSSSSTCSKQDGPSSPLLLDSTLVRIRTNFGDNQVYMPPETKPSRYNSSSTAHNDGAAAAPVTRTRDPVRATTSNNRTDRLLLERTLNLTLSPLSMLLGGEDLDEPATPTNQKRFQFFGADDDDDDEASDQIPFDQVWNQQEFSLPDSQGTSQDTHDTLQGDEDDNDNCDNDNDNCDIDDDDDDDDDVNEGDDEQSVKSETSQPFDEEVPERLELLGYSVFSAFSTNSATAPPPPPPPPPPPSPPSPMSQNKAMAPTASSPVSPSSSRRICVDSPTTHHATSSSISSHGQSSSSSRQNYFPKKVRITATTAATTTTVSGDPPPPPEGKDRVLPSSYHHPEDEYEIEHDGDEDIPSDEDDTKNNGSRLDMKGRDKQHLSLATASKRTTAEDVSQIRAAEDLSTSAKNNSKRIFIMGDEEEEKEQEKGDDYGGGEKSFDSLFDFQEQWSLSPRSSSAEQALSQGRCTSPRAPTSTGLPSPTEDARSLQLVVEGSAARSEAVPGLKTRTQEAFASRKMKTTSSSPSPSPPLSAPSPDPPSPPQQQPPKSKASVSFGATNTIHHFENESSAYSDDQEESAVSDENNNFKTIGSDVEDAIRDIFMINALGACNPPSSNKKRSIRYHSDTRNEKRDLEQNHEQSEDDDGTSVQSEDDPSTGKSTATTSGQPYLDGVCREDVLAANSEDVFFETMLSIVEGGLGAMSAAFGFASMGGEENEPDTATTFSPRMLPEKATRRSFKRSDSADSNTMEGMVDSMSDYALGNENSSSSSSSSEDADLDVADDDDTDYGMQYVIVPNEEEVASPSLEDDPRLLELAKQAALCVHEVLGARYDESRDVDIADVKFQVVELSLPLGIIFQEDYSGCWITKIMPKGNADQSGKVEPGDQLAAINGKSAIGMKVDDICAAITDASSIDEEIELTFLRYIGPFQPLPPHGNHPAENVVGEDVEEEYKPENIQRLSNTTIILEDEQPRSTMSIMSSVDSKSTNKSQQSQSTKRGSKKRFKWFGRGKRSATSKAE